MTDTAQQARNVFKEWGLHITSLLSVFLLSAFYYDVKQYGEELKEINVNMAVLTSNSISHDKRLTSVETDVKKLDKGFVNLETRVGYLESGR